MTPQGKTGIGLAGVAVVMLSLSFAAVPFYNWFCKVTGFAGTTSVASEGSDVVLDQTILVRFDGNVDHTIPWEFAPVVTTMELRIGENGLAFFRAHNPTNKTIAGTASYNVTPDQAGGYFTKIACFCFEQQVLGPHETVDMPVSFYVDPEIVNDPEGKFVREITLSYTFHQTDLPEQAASLTPAQTGASN
jgi:cytochrome c oxidase assembly protein subunit 11